MELIDKLMREIRNEKWDNGGLYGKSKEKCEENERKIQEISKLYFIVCLAQKYPSINVIATTVKYIYAICISIRFSKNRIENIRKKHIICGIVE